MNKNDLLKVVDDFVNENGLWFEFLLFVKSKFPEITEDELTKLLQDNE